MIKNFINDETGMETVEWAVVAALPDIDLMPVTVLIGNNSTKKISGLKSAIY